jgi:hypothetical protein
MRQALLSAPNYLDVVDSKNDQKNHQENPHLHWGFVKAEDNLSRNIVKPS